MALAAATVVVVVVVVVIVIVIVVVLAVTAAVAVLATGSGTGALAVIRGGSDGVGDGVGDGGDGVGHGVGHGVGDVVGAADGAGVGSRWRMTPPPSRAHAHLPPLLVCLPRGQRKQLVSREAARMSVLKCSLIIRTVNLPAGQYAAAAARSRISGIMEKEVGGAGSLSDRKR